MMSAKVANFSLRHRIAHDRAKRKVESLLDLAGICAGGRNPRDLKVHDPRFYVRVLADGALGLGESYMDGWWDCERIDEFICRLLRAEIHRRVRTWRDLSAYLEARIVNLQDAARAREVGRRHYDIGNDLYRRMLDARMIYSCGYWKTARSLDEAQEAKLDLVCRKLGLEPGMRVLDIGCGWGGAAKFAAENYGVAVLGVTVSAEQAALAREICRGLPIEIQLKDYREIDGTFERAFSLGMFEHVGCKNYGTYMQVVAAALEDHGLFLLHTIGNNLSDVRGDSWSERYIFPNSMLPSAKQITAACEGRFVLEDWHNFGPDYDPTLLAWLRNFERHWPELKAAYGPRFYRMWKYYLTAFAGTFRARHNHVWQIVLSKKGLPGTYRAPR